MYLILEIAQLTKLMGKRKQVEHKSSWKSPEESLAQECGIQIQNFHLMKQYQTSLLYHQDEPKILHKWQALSEL